MSSTPSQSSHNPTPGPGAPRRADRKATPAREPSLTLLESLAMAKPIATRVARRSGLPAADVEDFCSVTNLLLVRKAETIQRRFRAEAAVSTFLESLIRNCLRDFLNSRLGKWRPSARASRLGALAIELERLREWDGYSDEEAFQILRRSWHRPVCCQDLDRLAGDLPPRARSREVSWNDVSTAELAYEQEPLEDNQQSPQKVGQALDKALRDLRPSDVTLLRRHFCERTPFSRLARQRGMRQRALYSLKDRLLRRLRRRLEAEGVRWPQVNAVLSDTPVELDSILARAEPGPNDSECG